VKEQVPNDLPVSCDVALHSPNGTGTEVWGAVWNRNSVAMIFLWLRESACRVSQSEINLISGNGFTAERDLKHKSTRKIA